MKLNDLDLPLLEAFLTREADDYQWREETKAVNRPAFIQKMRNEIVNGLEALTEGADFVCIHSLTNMGVTSRELRITPIPWDFDNEVTILLPPNPRNGGTNIKFNKKERNGPQPS